MALPLWPVPVAATVPGAVHGGRTMGLVRPRAVKAAASPWPASCGRWLYRLNVPHARDWQGRSYAIKQVAPVVAETDEEFVVITVYTFYF